MSEWLASIAPAVGDNLWQSTVFAAVAALLAVLLRKNQARTRYWIWLAALMKFLAPFSLLIALGGLLPRPQSAPAATPTTYAAMDAMDTVTEPFAAQASPITPTHTAKNILPETLASLWFCGMVVFFTIWCLRWRRVAAIVRQATEPHTGREVELLRRLERDTGMRPVRLLLSPSSMEPGMFGVLRPVLLWPEGMSARLSDGQMEAILAHELCHVRRRDNLFAMAQMVVETVFWFYPLVWWMGRRMVEERERACDEEVLAHGRSAETYAESILKICEFCLESPLACVSGITGADLKRRIVQIMTRRAGHKLGFGRRCLLLTVAVMAVAVPIVLGIAQEKVAVPIARVFHPIPPLPSFDVATVKPVDPGGSTPPNGMPTRTYIRLAYSPAGGPLPPTQVIGGPEWLDKDMYSITGKPPADLELAMKKMRAVDWFRQDRAMRQSLLVDRFHLKVHFEVREMPIYALVPAKGGLKIKAVAYPDLPAPDGPSSPPAPGKPPSAPGSLMIGGAAGGGLTLWAHTISMAQLVGMLGSLQTGASLGMTGSGSDRPVVDQTGFAGYFDIEGMEWAPLISATPSESPNLPSLGTALEETLGLRLMPTKGPVEVVVIDSIERPSEN